MNVGSEGIKLDGWVCVHCLLGEYLGCTGIHYGKKTTHWKQCDALGNVFLGNLGSCHPCECHLDASWYQDLEIVETRSTPWTVFFFLPSFVRSVRECCSFFLGDHCHGGVCCD